VRRGMQLRLASAIVALIAGGVMASGLSAAARGWAGTPETSTRNGRVDTAPLPPRREAAQIQLSKDICGVIPKAWLLATLRSAPGNISGPIITSIYPAANLMPNNGATCLISAQGTYSFAPCKMNADGISVQLFEAPFGEDESSFGGGGNGSAKTPKQWVTDVSRRLHKAGQGASITSSGDLATTTDLYRVIGSGAILDVGANGSLASFKPICASQVAFLSKIANRITPAVRALPLLPDKH
jgi:hypothetical protein